MVKDWGIFVQKLHEKTEYRRDRIAYAWIYYQLDWLGASLVELHNPLHESFNTAESWTALIERDPGGAGEEEKERWRKETLPLLARPEIGLEPKVQKNLLKFVGSDPERQLLWDQRRRLMTDAIIAANDEIGGSNRDAEDREQIERIINVFERRHRDTHGVDSPWFEAIEEPVRGSKSSSTASTDEGT